MEDSQYLILLGMKINVLRKERGQTQTDLAELVGTSKTQIIRIERGEVNSTINMLRKLAAVFDMSIEELVKV